MSALLSAPGRSSAPPFVAAEGIHVPRRPPPAPPDSKAAAPAEPLELAQLYRAHAPSVFRWAARLAGPELGRDVEDLVQEVFLVAHRHLGGFRGEAKITTWLFRITRNVVRHRQRRERLRRLFSGPEKAAETVPSNRPTPIEELEREEARRITYRVLDGMSEKYRTVFILFEIEGLSGEEIGALTGQKMATVWVWLHRARAHFAKGLAAIERQAGPAAGRPGTQGSGKNRP